MAEMLTQKFLLEIEAVYAGILNKPFTGYYNGEHYFTKTTHNSRMVICFRGDDEFEGLVTEAIQRVNAVEQRHHTRIWKGVVGDWMYNLYIAPKSIITEEEAKAGNTFKVYRVEPVEIHPDLKIRWPVVCNLYVRALSPTTGSVE